MSRKEDRPQPPSPNEDDGYEVPINRRRSLDDGNLYDSIGYHDQNRKMVVRNLPTDVSNDILQLYFESKKHHERKMEVEQVDIYEEQNMAVITFEKPEDVKYVLERQTRTPCKLQKQTLVLESFHEIESNTSVDIGSHVVSQDCVDMYDSAGVKDEDGTDTIEVRGFSESGSEDALRFYFENNRRSGGGNIKSFTMNREKGFAHITFEDRSAVRSVVARKHKLEDHDLDLHVYFDINDSASAKDEDGTDTIEVRGFSESCREDTLSFYFENNRRSGGGDIKSFTMYREKGFALITFEDRSVVKSVVERKHKVEDHDLDVHPIIISKTDLLVEGITDSVTQEYLTYFLEAKLKVTVISVEYNQEKNKALVQFDNEIDFEKAEVMCKEHKLYGQHVVPVQVPVSNGIIVTNIHEDAKHNKVVSYFQNPTWSMGGDIVKVEDHIDEGYALIYFKNPKVVSSVCQKKDHKLKKCPVQVQPYYAFLGIPYGCEISTFKLPEPVSLADENPYKMKLLMKNDKQRTKLEQKLKKCNAEIIWDEKPIVVECTLSKDDKPNKKLLKSWTEATSDVIKHRFDRLVVKEKKVEPEVWDATIKDIGTLPLQESVLLIMEKDNKKIILVVKKKISENVWKQIVKVIKTADKNQKEMKAIIKEEKVLDNWKIEYLKAAGFQNEMCDENLKMNFEEKKGEGNIILEGPKARVHNVLLSMHGRLHNVRRRDADIGKENAKLLQKESTKDNLRQQMKKQGVSDVMEVKMKEGSVILYADDDDDLTKMETAVNEMFAKLCFNLDSGTESILKSSAWKTLCDKYSGCLFTNERNGHIEIFTLSEIQNQVSTEFQGFFSKNAVFKEQLNLSPHIVILINTVLKNQFEKELKTMKDRDLNISITLDDAKGTVSFEGTSDGITKGKDLIQKLKKDIHTGQHKLKCRKVKSYLACSQGKECVKKVQENTPCVIDMEGSGFKKSCYGQNPTVTTFDEPTLCAEATLKHDIQLAVYCGDITKLDVDVLVNAANKQLKHVGGLAAVIINKGGREIQSECNDLVRVEGPLSDGDVFMSKAGKLKCKEIAHAVGPHWKGGGEGEEMCLQKAVYTCLEETEKKKFKSIAMPALSAGMFHYPVDMSCLAIVKAIYQHFENSKSCIKEVIVCDISQTTVYAFTNAVQNVVPNLKILVDLSQGDSPKPAWLINTDDDRRKSAAGRHLKVDVVKAELANEKVDVIVNSASPDLQLKKGASSNAILQAAGDAVQQECDQNYPHGIKEGEVATTTAGKMKCSKIFHITIRHFDKDKQRECLKSVGLCVRNCLDEADQNGHNSISFPAMGTGAQRYPKDRIAKEMFKTVSTFFKDNPSSSIKTVRFVIYTEDDETFEAFVTEEKNWVGKEHHHQTPTVIRKVSTTALTGKLLQESQGTATFQIGNLKLDIFEGDITEEDTMAIVASCNMDLDLSKGAVTKALLKKGGKAIQKDCKHQKETMKKEGIAITTAGQLRSKYIIHIDTKYKTWEWKPAVKACLDIAEKHKFTSVAFPALGTSVGCKPEEIAAVIVSAIGEFVKGNPSHMQQIRLVIFQKDMVLGFIEGIKKSIEGRPVISHQKDSDRQPIRLSKYRKVFKDVVDESEDYCNITIYAESTEKIQTAKNMFDKVVQDEWHIKKIEDEGIHRLSAENINEIRKMAKNYHVEVQVDTDVGFIEVIGLVANVINVNDVIHSQLRSADMSFYKMGQAQLMSNMVQWIYLKDQKEYPFPNTVNLDIETAYRNKDTNVKVKDRSGGEYNIYNIDFGKMEENDVKTPNMTFPVIRRDLIAGASLDIPKTWKIMTGSENLDVVTLDPKSQEYAKVEAEFTKTLNASSNIVRVIPNIVRIERIQNKTLYTQYSAKRKELNNNNPKEKQNERVLWHGTAEAAVPSINAHGFNRSYCGKNATLFGDGVYFAVDSSYSHQDKYSPVSNRDNCKRMYRCLVLTGKYCSGKGGMRVPPPINKSQSHILYDSVTNNIKSPSMFVVFNDTQAYPEHLIVYK